MDIAREVDRIARPGRAPVLGAGDLHHPPGGAVGILDLDDLDLAFGALTTE
ncbi:MAG: hypothetical protein IPM08_15895 [Actinomycetales bacterium]|nr:hypothetical protein [Actinomycetales bacterium]MBK8758538.1 hypothetical protein [Actinomycetales bacterium]